MQEIESELENERKVCAKLADALVYSKQEYVNTEKKLIEVLEKRTFKYCCRASI